MVKSLIVRSSKRGERQRKWKSPNDKSSRKATHWILHQVFEVSVAEQVKKEASSIPRLNVLAPRLPAMRSHLRTKKRVVKAVDMVKSETFHIDGGGRKASAGCEKRL